MCYNYTCVYMYVSNETLLTYTRCLYITTSDTVICISSTSTVPNSHHYTPTLPPSPRTLQHTHTHTHTHIYTQKQTHIHLNILTHTYSNTYRQTKTHTRIHTHTHIQTHGNTHIHKHTISHICEFPCGVVGSTDMRPDAGGLLCTHRHTSTPTQPCMHMCSHTHRCAMHMHAHTDAHSLPHYTFSDTHTHTHMHS
eukprot:GHVQ01042728.1.p1 GENE.GHVQ01042728.1~~GHVQ01042728.1.p1  ORF type:complete len:195 (+),score=39.29 GHVQ01042728.1:212-796(+)